MDLWSQVSRSSKTADNKMNDTDEDEDSIFNATEDVLNFSSLPQHELRAGKGCSQDEEIVEAVGSECPYDGDSSSPVTLKPSSSSIDLQELDSDSLSSGSSLFLTQCVHTPQRTARNRKLARHVSRPSVPGPPEDSADSSSDSTAELNWRESFDRHFNKKKYRKRKYIYRNKRTGGLKGRPRLSIPRLKQQRQSKDKGFQFPFVAKEELPRKMILNYEQAAVLGFFQCMDKLKYKRHLQTSIHEMGTSEDSEQEGFDGPKQKYLDEDGPISPIQEPNQESDPEVCDAKIVENSCFILSCNLPSKKEKSKERRKTATRMRQEKRMVKGVCCSTFYH